MMDEKDMAEQAYKNGYNKSVIDTAEKYYWRIKTIIECWESSIKKHVYQDILKSNEDLRKEFIKYGQL